MRGPVASTLITSAAPYSISGRSGRPGLQIDLLIQTRKSVCVVKTKRKAEIDASVEKDVEQKVSRQNIGSDKSVRTALVYSGKLASEVVESGYFDALINIEDLF